MVQATKAVEEVVINSLGSRSDSTGGIMSVTARAIMGGRLEVGVDITSNDDEGLVENDVLI